MIVPAPGQSNVFTVLRTVLTSILANGSAVFTGTVVGTTLTVASVNAIPPASSPGLGVGSQILGANVAPGTFITALGTGAGGTGTYTVNISQAIPPVASAAPALMWSGVPVIQGQINRAPEPKAGDFVVMTPLFRKRLATNTDTYGDVCFTASIADNVMTVTETAFGTIAPGQTLFGVGVADGTMIVGPGTDPGTYIVTPAQTVGSRKMASGGEFFFQPTEVTIQLDVHGPNSADNAQIISTILRDEYGFALFAQVSTDVRPLHADDPKQIPFLNGEQQIETRWVVDAHLQANVLMRAPMQFADQLDVGLIEVDATYPA